MRSQHLAPGEIKPLSPCACLKVPLMHAAFMAIFIRPLTGDVFCGAPAVHDSSWAYGYHAVPMPPCKAAASSPASTPTPSPASQAMIPHRSIASCEQSLPDATPPTPPTHPPIKTRHSELKSRPQKTPFLRTFWTSLHVTETSRCQLKTGEILRRLLNISAP